MLRAKFLLSRFLGRMPLSHWTPRTRILLSLGIVLLFVAALRLRPYVFHSEYADTEHGDLSRVMQWMHCLACGERYQVSAQDYVDLVHDRDAAGGSGLRCGKCGLFRAAHAGSVLANERPPDGFPTDMTSVTREDIERAMEGVNARLQEIEQQLLDPALENDPARREELTARRNDLTGQSEWLNDRWEELVLRTGERGSAQSISHDQGRAADRPDR